MKIISKGVSTGSHKEKSTLRDKLTLQDQTKFDRQKEILIVWRWL